jgi:type I restriction enzyme S subunit
MQINVPMVKLGEVLTEHQEKPNLESVMTGEIPIIAKIGFNTGIIEFRDGFATKTNMILVKPGDLVVSGINAEKGAIALYDESNSKNCAATIHYSSYSIDKKKADPKFLWFFFRSEMFRNLLIYSLPNGIKTELKPFRLLKLGIPLPPLEEQGRIVAMLERLMGKIAGARKERAGVVEESRELRRDATIKILEQYPTEYWRALREVIDIEGGSTPSKSNPTYYGGNIPWIRPQNMKTIEIYKSSDYVSQSAIDDSSLKIIQPGAILVVIRGMILVHTVPSAILRVPATINQDMKALIPRKEILPEYLCTILWGLNQEILQLVEKSGHDTRRLPTPSLLSLKIPVPSIPEQRRIVAHLDRLQAKVDEVKRLQAESEREMEALVPAVLAKAFGGVM